MKLTITTICCLILLIGLPLIYRAWPRPVPFISSGPLYVIVDAHGNESIHCCAESGDYYCWDAQGNPSWCSQHPSRAGQDSMPHSKENK